MASEALVPRLGGGRTDRLFFLGTLGGTDNEDLFTQFLATSDACLAAGRAPTGVPLSATTIAS